MTVGEVTRRTVTVVFTDIVGSTELAEQLDPEILRPALGRYFDATRDAVERHGGTVEKYIGDAVMAIFGYPAAHEDDALRAVRAAVEIHAAVETLAVEFEPELGRRLHVRTGIQTGEVLAGTGAPGEPVATGDAVNTAARLQAVAPPGAIVLGGGTLALVRDAVEAAPLPPLELKGKAEPVSAARLIRLDPGATGIRRHLDARFVGRASDLEQILAIATEVWTSSRARFAIVVGEPGVGKTRLVARFLEGLSPDIVVLRTTVPPYGGSTFGPLAELVRAANDDVPADGVVAVLAGLADGTVAREEIPSAVRRYLEAVAEHRPLVVVIDDLHWAEQVLVDALDHVGRRATGPVLVLATARPEIDELLPRGPDGDRPIVRIDLGPLAATDTEAIVNGLLGGEVEESIVERVVDVTRGNPLFVEQLLATLLEEGRIREVGGRWSGTDGLVAMPIPASVGALVTARLDRLAPDHRRVLEAVSVVGLVADRELIDAVLTHDATGVGPIEEAVRILARAAMIEEPTIDGTDITFRHVLVREAVYAAIPKRARADLHLRLGDRLEADPPAGLTGLAEAIGYHLEAAWRYRTELRQTGEATDVVASRAAEYLTTAGRRAYGSGAMPGAADLLGRATNLMPADDPARIRLLPELAKARVEIGDSRALETLDTAVAETARIGLERENAYARIHRFLYGLWFQRHVGDDADRADMEEIGTRLEGLGDDRGAALAWSAIAEIEWARGRVGGANDAIDRAAALAKRAGDRWAYHEYLALSAGDINQTVPRDEFQRRSNEALEHGEGDPVVAARALPCIGWLLADSGHVEEGRARVVEAIEHTRELGLRMWESEITAAAAYFELDFGDAEDAYRLASRAYDIGRSIGDAAHTSWAAAVLARASTRLGRDEETLRWAAQSHATRPADVSPSELYWMIAVADVHRRSGRLGEAEHVARQALEMFPAEPDSGLRAEAEVSLGHVLRAEDREAEANELFQSAADRWERLGYQRLAAASRMLM